LLLYNNKKANKHKEKRVAQSNAYTAHDVDSSSPFHRVCLWYKSFVYFFFIDIRPALTTDRPTATP
jgi:hypothetical protein